MREDLDARHWALRVARRIARTPRGRRHAVGAGIAAGRLLHLLHADRAGMAAFSMVWDLTYCEALREALSMRDGVGSSP